MTSEEWRHRIETLQLQADALASTAQWPGTLKEALEILQTSLAELHVTAEDMRRQHEAVAVIPDPQSERVRLLWLLRDITGHTQAEATLRHAYEALEQRVRERTAALAVETNAVKRLAYRISQDLRAPLITMSGFAHELRTACDMLKTALPPLLPPVEAPQRTAMSHALDHDIHEALRFIEAAVTQMDSHIQALLDFSRR